MDKLNKKQLLKLLKTYDIYIQDSNDNRRADWYPVCIEEFYNNEFQELINE